MDEKLLAEARHAQERLINAKRDADVARADFHRAVRRLHLHGSSLRELAAELGWLNTAPGQDKPIRCSFCGKDRDRPADLAMVSAATARKTFAAICGECLALCGEILVEELGT